MSTGDVCPHGFSVDYVMCETCAVDDFLRVKKENAALRAETTRLRESLTLCSEALDDAHAALEGNLSCNDRHGRHSARCFKCWILGRARAAIEAADRALSGGGE